MATITGEEATTRRSGNGGSAAADGEGGPGTAVREAAGTVATNLAGAAETVAARLPEAAAGTRSALDEAARRLRTGTDVELTVGASFTFGLAVGLLVGGAGRLLVALALIPAAAMGLSLADRASGRNRTKPSA